MSVLLVVPVGEVERSWVDLTAQFAAAALQVETAVMPPIAPPPSSVDPVRKQHSAPAILESLLPSIPPREGRVLGLTADDIFIPMLTFLFGQAQLGGRVALVSLARLKPEFYGLPPDPDLTALRLRKEILHEVGHLYGLTHCPQQRCAMSLANSILQVDVKEDAFCPACRETLAKLLVSNGNKEHR